MAKLAERFGKEVRARRKARGFTQRQLSEASNLSEEWVRRIERGLGAPSFDALDALASALACEVADLFGTMSPRDTVRARIDALLTAAPDADLLWLEDLVRVAIRRPAS